MRHILGSDRAQSLALAGIGGGLRGGGQPGARHRGVRRRLRSGLKAGFVRAEAKGDRVGPATIRVTC